MLLLKHTVAIFHYLLSLSFITMVKILKMNLLPGHLAALAIAQAKAPYIQCVLSLPFFLPAVFDHILWDEDCYITTCPVKGTVGDPDRKEPHNHYCDKCECYDRHGVLLRCMLVSRHWFDMAVKVLWRFPSKYEYGLDSLARRMMGLEKERRQFYADLVEEATEMTGKDKEKDEALEGLKFPKLKKVRLMTRDAYVPKIEARGVESVVIDPHYEPCNPEYYGVTQGEMERVLEQIVELWPDAREVVFEDSALAWPGAMERFRKRMGRLEVFDHKLVTETDVPWMM